LASQSGIGEGTASYNGFHLKTMDSHGGWVMSRLDLVRFADAIDGREAEILKAIANPLGV
jgi:hypothetical protein